MTVLFAAVHEAGVGTERRFWNVRFGAAFGVEWTFVSRAENAAFDPGCVKTHFLAAKTHKGHWPVA